MHLNHLIKAIVFPSVPLGELMNTSDFCRIPKFFRPPYGDISDDPIYSGRGGGSKHFRNFTQNAHVYKHTQGHR